MEGDMINTLSGKGMEDAFALLEMSLREVNHRAGTPLAAQLNVLAVIAHVAYVQRNLKALSERWRSRLPLVGDAWAEVDFKEWGGRLLQAWKTGRRLLEGSSGLPYFHVEQPVPAGMKGWRLWHLEEAYDRDRDTYQPGALEQEEYQGMGMDKKIDAPDYKNYLQPTSSFNECFFWADDLKRWGCEPKGIREVSLALSGPGSGWILKVLDKGVDEMARSLMELEELRTGICAAGPDEEARAEKEALQGKQLSDFYTGIYQEYVETHGKAVAAECERWGAAYTPRMKAVVVESKMKGEFAQLLDSGFLRPLLADYGCAAADAEKAEQVFRAAFFDDKGRVCPSLVGRYIYAHQFAEEGWLGMTQRFLRFVYLEILTDKVTLPGEIADDEVFPPSIYDEIFDDKLDMAKVKKGLGEILTMKTADGHTLQDRKYLCYVVFNALCDMKWIPKRKDSGKFREWAEAVYGELGKFSKPNFDAGRNQWAKEKDSSPSADKEGVCEEMDLMVWQMFQGRDGEREKLYLKSGRRPVCNPGERKKLE